MMTKPKEQLTIFSIGAISYSLIELIWRHYTHWSMGLTGGACFLILYDLYRHFSGWSLWKKCAAGSAVITSMEFLVGLVVNVWQKWDVWDYSQVPFNLMGQICLPYSFLWFLLSLPIVWVSGKINQLLVHPKKPLAPMKISQMQKL
ncbi:MAG: putative ABC transporter permease [Massiliimalia sp.]